MVTLVSVRIVIVVVLVPSSSVVVTIVTILLELATTAVHEVGLHKFGDLACLIPDLGILRLAKLIDGILADLVVQNDSAVKGSFHEGVNLVVPVVLETSVHQSVVSYLIAIDTQLLHFIKDLECSVEVSGLDACLDQTRVDNESWPDILLLHVIKYVQCLVQLPSFAVNLDQDAECDIAWLNLEDSHVRVDFQSHV